MTYFSFTLPVVDGLVLMDAQKSRDEQQLWDEFHLLGLHLLSKRHDSTGFLAVILTKIPRQIQANSAGVFAPVAVIACPELFEG